MTYYHIQDGEWVAVRRSGWRHQCCDCGAVHDLAARNRQGRLEIRFRINRRATAAARRPFKFMPKEELE